MDLQCKDEEIILSFVSEAVNWTEDETKSKLKEFFPVLMRFLSSNEDSQIGIQVIKFTFSSFLPHIYLSSFPKEFMRATLSALVVYVNRLIMDLEKENDELTNLQEKLEYLILCLESSKIYLSYVSKQETLTHDVNIIESLVLEIIIHSLQHCKNKNTVYEEKELTEMFQSLLKETSDNCILFCDIIVSITWTDESFKDGALMARIVEKLSVIAHTLSCLAELKSSIKAWKTVAFFVQNHSDVIRKTIVLKEAARFLYEEIRESLYMLKSFGKGPGEILEEAEEDIIMRVLRRGCFNLKILILIAENFVGYLRDSSETFLSVILILFRFSSDGFELQGLPVPFQNKINGQLCTGAVPLLNILLNDNSFIDDIENWTSKYKLEDEVDTNEASQETEEESDYSSSSSASFLILLVAAIKQLLSDPFAARKEMLEIILMKKIFQVFPQCHAELCLPLKFPHAKRNCDTQTDASLYVHTLVHMCALVSVTEEDQFRSIEEVLFGSLFSDDNWSSLFASDVICFVTRYGSGDLCESYCNLLIEFLGVTFLVHYNKMAVNLLSRILGFLSPGKCNQILSKWILETKPNKIVLAELLFHLNLSSISFQDVATEYLLDGENDVFARFFKCSESGLSSHDVIRLFEVMNIIRLYLGSSCVQIQAVDSSLRTKLVSSLTSILMRIPVNNISFTFVSKLFCETLRTLSVLKDSITSMEIYQVLCICNDIASPTTCPDVSLSICSFASNFASTEFDDTPSQSRSNLLKKIEDIFVQFLSHSNSFVHMMSIRNFVHFAQNTKYEQVFPNSVSKLESERNNDVINYLKNIQLEVDENCARKCLVLQAKNPKNYKRIEIIQIPIQSLDALPLVEYGIGSFMENNKENDYKKRKMETCNKGEIEIIIDDIEELKKLLISTHNKIYISLNEKINIKSKLLDLVNTWENNT